jgi:predicted PurR-regulated permease PerM
MIAAAPTREVVVRPRTVLMVIGLVVAAWLSLWVVRSTWQVLTWVLIAVVLALALDPAVRALERRGLGRGTAVICTMLVALAVFALIATLLVPPLLEEATGLVEATPAALADLSSGRGPLGELQRDHDIVGRLRDAVQERGAEGILGITSPAMAVVQGVLNLVAATVTVFFLCLFMLLEGRRWADAFVEALPERNRGTWRRILRGVAGTVSGYVTGNLVISVIAGVVAGVAMIVLDVPYALPLAVLVALLDLIPLVGATAGAVIVCAVAWFTAGPVAFVALAAVFLVYQQIENSVIQPVVYGRAVRLSPLSVLLAVLIGSALAGVVGALAAIPVAASGQVVVREVMAARREREAREGPRPAAW